MSAVSLNLNGLTIGDVSAFKGADGSRWHCAESFDTSITAWSWFKFDNNVSQLTVIAWWSFATNAREVSVFIAVTVMLVVINGFSDCIVAVVDDPGNEIIVAGDDDTFSFEQLLHRQPQRPQLQKFKICIFLHDTQSIWDAHF